MSRSYQTKAQDRDKDRDRDRDRDKDKDKDRDRGRRANQRKHGLQGGSEMTIDVEKQASQRVDQCENSKNRDIQ